MTYPFDVVLFRGCKPGGNDRLVRERTARDGEIWATNEIGIARGYGHDVVEITIPAGTTIHAYPTRTGDVEVLLDPYSEPTEFLILPDEPFPSVRHVDNFADDVSWIRKII